MTRSFLTSLLLLAIGLTLITGCKPPPPAPEGLDASTTYLLRNFYARDVTFDQGIVGFVEWFEAEGVELLGADVDAGNIEAFTVSDLTADDVAHLPLVHGRDIAESAGVVSLFEMSCDVDTAERLLTRPDQDTVFEDDWASYDRSHITPREPFEAATVSEEYAPIVEDLLPFEDGYDSTPNDSTIYQTLNVADPAPASGFDFDPYDLTLDLRHGIYNIDGVDTKAFTIITFQTDSVPSENGNSFLHQTYSVEINVAREEGKTLRMLVVWAEVAILGIDPHSATALVIASRKAESSMERLAEICDGTETIDPE